MRNSICRTIALSLGSTVFALMLAGPVQANHVKVQDVQANYNDIYSNTYNKSAPMGVSTSSKSYIVIHNLGYCYAGTLGAEVTDSRQNYVLSNNHVLAKENTNLDFPKSENRTIVQAGLMDAGNCTSKTPGTDIATLSRYVTVQFSKGSNIKTNYVDAAIAVAKGGTVNPAILGLGNISGYQNSTDLSLGDIVQKVGRTTAHTMGVVTTIKNSLKVSYESGTAYFDNQIGIEDPCGGKFSDSGDSGSLITAIPKDMSPPLAVGLLFAGGGSYTWANEIEEVLAELNGGGKITGTNLLVNMDGSPAVDLVTGAGYTGPAAADYANYESSCPTSGGGGRPSGKGKKKFVKNPAGLNIAANAQKSHSSEIFAMRNVVGHGIGEDDDGNAVINIYVSQDPAGAYYPSQIGGVKVRVIKTGPIKAY
jgi:hypothetical protein